MANTADNTLVEVLEQNLEAAEQVRSASSELEVVHIVLSSQVSMPEAVGDLPAAIERTEVMAQQLAETAEALDKSNELLREIAEANRS